MSVSTYTSDWRSRTKAQLLEDLHIVIEQRDAAIARAQTAESQLVADRAELKAEKGRDHVDALADTADAYTQFHGWVLTCSWCDFECRGKTKAAAIALMQHHYDDLISGFTGEIR